MVVDYEGQEEATYMTLLCVILVNAVAKPP